jgi:2-dehydropantoate 2-reductase
LIGRPDYVAAVKEHGLRFETRNLDLHVPLTATVDASGVADADIVLFCVKSADTEPAGRAMSGHLKQGAVVLSLQNGVDNAERLRSILTAEVIPAVVYVAAELAGPGHVKHHGRGDLVIGAGSNSASIASKFIEAGIPTVVSQNVAGELWNKLVTNCAYNALSAVPHLSYGQLMKVEGVIDVMRDVVGECSLVARALGVALPDDMFEKVRALAAAMPDQYSSTAQDLARGKTTEIDYLNGYVVRKGQELGVPTPANRALHVLVKLREVRAGFAGQ